MRKKFHISFREGLDTLFCRKREKVTDYERAKELYLNNFANFTTMSMNGEYDEYRRFCVSVDKERKWSEEVKELLVGKILSGNDMLQVINLSRVNLPENEIMDAFRALSVSPRKREILEAIKLLKPLFEYSWYEKIVTVFV